MYEPCARPVGDRCVAQCKRSVEDLLQSVEAIMIAYAQALLIDQVALKEAQQSK